MIRSETNFRFEFVDGVETEPDESEISLCILLSKDNFNREIYKTWDTYMTNRMKIRWRLK